MSTPPVTMDQFLDHLNMETAGDSELELELTLSAATDLVESHVGPMSAREVTESAYSRCGSIMLREWPVVSFTSITDPDGGDVDVATVEQYAGVVTVTYPGVPFGAGSHVIVYEAGWDPVPDALKLATLIVAKHLWETQRNAGRTGLVGVGVPDEPFVGRGFALPNRAVELMAAYSHPGVS